MDINKLNSISNNNINKADKTDKGEYARDTSKSSADLPTDKVLLDDYQFRNNDQLFAKLELEKLNDNSSDQLQQMKQQVSEFLEASEESVQETKMGGKVNDPAIWENIAYKILQ